MSLAVYVSAVMPLRVPPFVMIHRAASGTSRTSAVVRNTCSAERISRRTCWRTIGSSSDSASSSKRIGAVPTASVIGRTSASLSASAESRC